MSEANEMKLRYTYFQLPEEKEFVDYNLEHGRSLGKLGFINLFIGQNNSGKSRLLRMLFADRSISYQTLPAVSEEYNCLINNVTEYILKKYTHLIASYKMSDPRKCLNRFDIGFTEPSKHPSIMIDSYLKTVPHSLDTVAITGQNQSSIEKGKGLLREAYKDLKQYQKKIIPKIASEEKRFYIPVLRGLRSLPSFAIDISNQNDKIAIPIDSIQNATIRDYFSKHRSSDSTILSNDHHVFSGLELYGLLRNMLLGFPEQREQVRTYERFLSDSFFQGKEVTLIPYVQSDVVYLKIGNDEQRPIYDLGDGLQSLIICTFNAFMEKDRCSFYIEEPDTYMHPGMQRAFISALKECPQHQYFITTHSNHMLDMTLDFSDISVFRFSNTEKAGKTSFHVQECSSDDRNLLRELGVQNSSVFLTNATIWVEGITDRRYLRSYMKKYLTKLKESGTPEDIAKYLKYSQLKEDVHYSFVEYQGSCLGHWFKNDEDNFDSIDTKKLCADALVIADGDVRGKPRTQHIYKSLGDNLVILDCKEIENLIPEEILIAVLPDVYSVATSSMETIRYSDYSKEGVALGEYLESSLKTPRPKALFQADSGTVLKKTELSNKAVALMESSDDWSLTEFVISLVERIYAHIYEQQNV